MCLMTEIQNELKAPKGQFNKFGNYNYRSCEDIVEAVKPILKDKGCWLNISDEIEAHGDRIYVRANASVMQDQVLIASASGFAREPFTRKGMDDSQITGAASSYARKYALNGLFAIDDTKDADTKDNRIDNTTEIREAYVVKAFTIYSEEVEKEIYEENGDGERMREVEKHLSNDERIEVMNRFGKQTVEGGKKQLKTIALELLKSEQREAA